MNALHALVVGAAGAATLNALHEGARHVLPEAPRADLLGMRALARTMRAADAEPPPPDTLRKQALVGDLLLNTAYYSLTGVGPTQGVWRRGLTLGAVAGAGTVVLPPILGLGRAPTQRTAATALLTVAWYAAGGLAAAAAARALAQATSSAPGKP